MRLLKQRTISIAILVAFVLSLAVPMVHAQDEMTHTCDSTTIMLLFVAEHEYGYEPMMDVSTFEKGQYAPLFEAMMMMDDEMMEEDMSEDEMMEEDMSEDDMMEEDEMMDDMMMLAAPVIADEDPACTELRTSVEDWLYAHFEMGMMMMEDEG